MIKRFFTEEQYDALNNIRGLREDAHYMVILAKKADDGYVLEGTEKTFDGLIIDLFDEVEFEMQPKAKLKHLRQLISEISPEGDF
jgi:transcriptional regulator with AAA-type ATPase domain